MSLFFFVHGERSSLGQPKVNKVTFSALSKVYETSTNQISRSYHEGIKKVKICHQVKIYR